MAAVLIRHTRLEGNAGHCYGRHDFPLASSFPSEAAAVRERLPWQPTRVWCSPAHRCLRLAEVLAGAAPVEVMEALAELDFGAWEGRRWEELTGPDVEAWMQDPWNVRPPGGETAGELVERVRGVRAQALTLSAERLLVITHAGVIRAWASIKEGTTLEAAFSLPVGFGEIRSGD